MLDDFCFAGGDMGMEIDIEKVGLVQCCSSRYYICNLE
jgi:hypothetical protein